MSSNFDIVRAQVALGKAKAEVAVRRAKLMLAAADAAERSLKFACSLSEARSYLRNNVDDDAVRSAALSLLDDAEEAG